MERWIMDSDVTCHMTSKHNKWTSAFSCLGKRVHLPNVKYTSVSSVGKCKIIDFNVLNNVLVVHALKHDLITVS